MRTAANETRFANIIAATFYRDAASRGMHSSVIYVGRYRLNEAAQGAPMRCIPHESFVTSDNFHGIRIARGDHLIGTRIATGLS